MTPKELRSLVKFMRSQGVASFKVDGCEVVFERFTGSFSVPLSGPVDEESPKFKEFKGSLDMHLNKVSPEQEAEEHMRDLTWST